MVWVLTVCMVEIGRVGVKGGKQKSTGFATFSQQAGEFVIENVNIQVLTSGLRRTVHTTQNKSQQLTLRMKEIQSCCLSNQPIAMAAATEPPALLSFIPVWEKPSGCFFSSC